MDAEIKAGKSLMRYILGACTRNTFFSGTKKNVPFKYSQTKRFVRSSVFWFLHCLYFFFIIIVCDPLVLMLLCRNKWKILMVVVRFLSFFYGKTSRSIFISLAFHIISNLSLFLLSFALFKNDMHRQLALFTIEINSRSILFEFGSICYCNVVGIEGFVT